MRSTNQARAQVPQRRAGDRVARQRSIHIGSILGRLLAYGVLLGLSIFILLPIGWMLAAALKPDLTPVFTQPPEWWPTRYWYWENFVRVMSSDAITLLRYTLHTSLIAPGNIIGPLVSCSLA